MILESIMFALSISSLVSTEATGKSVTDHAISAYQDRDCKLARSVKGEDICQERGTITVSAPKEPVPPVVPTLPPKRVVLVQSAVDRMEDVFAQRKAAK